MKKYYKVIALAIANVLALFLIFFVWNYVVTGTPNDLIVDIFNESPPKTQEELLIEQRNIELMKEMENEKNKESIAIKEENLKKQKKSIEEREKKLENDLAVVDKERQDLLAEKREWEKEKQEQASYEKKLDSLATTFTSMPPERAVERLIAIDDDTVIIDILDTINRNAEENDQESIVPYFVSLMPKEDASRIMRKSTISF